MASNSLSLLCTYGSDSEDEGSDEPKARLPLPSEVKNLPSYVEQPEDNPTNHDGRVRSFPHERGNWCSLIYISCPLTRDFVDLVDAVVDYFYPDVDLKRIEDPHISLSRTFVLYHHWIDDFVKSVKNELRVEQRFSVDFDGIQVYSNDDKSRTFLGLTVSNRSSKLLAQSVSKIDKCLKEFKLQPFYEEASFHMSIGWCLGDQEEVMKKTLEEYSSELSNVLQHYHDTMSFQVETYVMKIGNKIFSMKLM